MVLKSSHQKKYYMGTRLKFYLALKAETIMQEEI